MSTRRFRWLAILAVIAALVILGLSVATRHPPGRARIVISFAGYTNLPNNSTRFALLSLQNRDSLAIRWRGDWVQVEGSQYNKAPTENPNLPFFTSMTLKKGDSLTVAIGEPLDGSRWRFSVLSSRYRLRERVLDFAMSHRLPTGIGHFSVINAEQILNRTNFSSNTSIWLVK